jgi:vacuolar-type H+-ATPase subunit C/Vma6
MNNLMWAIRYRTYHNLSEEEVINYTLPFGYKVGDADIRAIAAGADIAQVVKRVYPHLHDADQHLLDPHTGLPLLELDLQRQIAATCRAEFAGSPFNIGIPLAFLVLADYEVQDLVVLIEAKSKRLQADEFKQFLIIR